MQQLVEIFRRHYSPMAPEPTGVEPRLPSLPGIRAVLFDLYGTLFVSGSGEVGTTREAATEAAIEGAAKAMGVGFEGSPDGAADLMQACIRAFHAETTRLHGIDFPEVQIAEIWSDVFAQLARRGVLPESLELSEIDFRQFAVEYEARANPCWPMPHVGACLEALRSQGLHLGIVSNAQFYTPLLFPALLERSAEACGFSPDLQFFSYRHGFAKPGVPLFALAVRALAKRDILPNQALYVGNDMLNDIAPASRVGFRTALFAGDGRSLRLRQEDPRLAGATATIVITDLAQLVECTKIRREEES